MVTIVGAKKCLIFGSLYILYSLEESTGESLASDLYGGVGALKPQPVDWNKVEKVLLSNHIFFYYNTKSGSSNPRDENDFSGRKTGIGCHLLGMWRRNPESNISLKESSLIE